jgi:CBS domain-containing protein
MFVSKILADKGYQVATVTKSQTIYAVLAALSEHNVGALVVIADDGSIEGIISERDIVRALHAAGPASFDQSVSDLMTKDVSTCTEETSVATLMGIMTDQRIRHVPVLREGAMTGIVSIGDVVKARLGELELEKRNLLDYVSAR